MTNAIRYGAWTYTAAVQNPDASWTPPVPDTLFEGEWGTLRIEAGAVWDTSGTAVVSAAGTDITTVNGAATIIESLSFGEPYGELTGSLTVPELTPWDDPSAIGIEPGGNIDVYRVLPASLAALTGVDEVPYWHGIIASLEWADGHGIESGLSLQLVGALYGECSVRAHQPFMLDEAQDCGTWVGRALDPTAYARPLPPYQRFTFDSDTTGIDIRYRGYRGQTVIDYLDEVLALARDDDNGTWTVSRAYQVISGYEFPRARHYYLREKDTTFAGTVQTNQATVGGYGISYSLSYDVTETPTAIYGEGVHPTDGSELSGSRWRNARYPMLTTTAPAAPTRGTGSTYPIQSLDTDADFTTQAITQMQSQLRAGGWPDVRITGTFDDDTMTGLMALQEAIGTAVTGTVGGTAMWSAIWGTGSGYTDLGSGFFLPLYDANPYYTYAADGDVIGTASGYDVTRLRVDETISYGEGITQSRARKNAKRIVNNSDGAVGTITLTSDPVDENGNARSRLSIREGGWIDLGTNGMPDSGWYISGVSIAPEAEGMPVTLTVSTTTDDLLALTTKIERNRQAKSDPASSFYSQRTSSVRPFRSAVGWDAESGAGLIREFAAPGQQWSVARIVGSQYGSIQSLRVSADDQVGFAFAVFGGSVAGTALDALVPNPLAAMGTADAATSHWALPGIQSDLQSIGFIEAWGDADEHAGYYPGAYSNGTASAAGTPTGVLEDAGTWQFASLEPPFLYVAVWPDTAGTPTFSGQMRIAVDE